VTIGAAAPIQDLASEFTAKTGIDVKINTVDFNATGDTIDAYLGGAPEDLLTFLTGFLMRRVAGEGLLEPIDDVWASVGSTFPAALKEASTGDDGRLYALPYAHGPWAVFYRKSLFADRDYAIPLTWTDYLTLAKRIQRDGIAPMALADAEQFPALGIFDILNLRLNGYAFHKDLLAGRERWTDRRIHEVFDLFRQLLTTAQPDAVGRAWGDAVADLVEKRAAMLYFGTFATSAMPADVLPDLGLFAFPDLGTAFDAEKAVEDPSDAFVVPRNSPDLASDLDNAKAFLEYCSQPAVQSTLAEIQDGPGSLPAVDVGPAATSPLQHEAAQLVLAAQHATEFLDRDTNGAFGKRFGSLLKDFVAEPGQAMDAYLARVQATWDDVA
jgi:multiple sugar transport system substrate-binding protein